MPLFIPRDRRSLFRQFLAGMYDAVLITDPSGHILEINPRAEEYFGRSQDESIDRPISLFIKGLTPEIVTRIRHGLEQNRHMVIDATGLSADGSSFCCEVTSSMVDLQDPGDLVFSVRNVERRRKMREELRAKEAAFKLAGSALFTCAPDGRITSANGAFLEMFDLADEDAARSHVFSDLLDDGTIKEHFAKALAGETCRVRVVAMTEDGGSEATEVAFAPVLDGRKVRGVAGSVDRTL